VTLNLAVFLFTFALSILSEFYGIVMLHTHYLESHRYGALSILLFHVIAALLAALALHIHHSDKRRFAHFAFVFVLCLPVAGFLGVLQLLYETKDDTASKLFEEYRKHVDTGISGNVKSMLPLRKSLRYLRESIDIEPLAGSAEGGSARNRLSVIRSLGRIGTPSAVRALKEFLRDPHMDVRYYAGEEIAVITERFNLLINEIKTQITDRPGDWRLHCELGNLHNRHAQSGLFDEGSGRDELLKAKEALIQSLSLNDVQFEGHYLLGKALTLLEEFNEAIVHLKKAVEQKPDDLQVLVGIAECAWEMKDLACIDQYVDRMRELIEAYDGSDRVQIVEFLNSWPAGAPKGETADA